MAVIAEAADEEIRIYHFVVEVAPVVAFLAQAVVEGWKRVSLRENLILTSS